MRKVRARLLKFNELEESSEDEQKYEMPKKPVIPVNIPPVVKPATTSGPVKKKESKWGKTSSNEPSSIHPIVETVGQ